MNMIYLGFLTNHIPIIGMFTPSHIGGDIPPIDVSEVFDLARFQLIVQKPEWHQVKNRNSTNYESPLGARSLVDQNVTLNSPVTPDQTRDCFHTLFWKQGCDDVEDDDDDSHIVCFFNIV
jgi:hypothetical protein